MNKGLFVILFFIAAICSAQNLRTASTQIRVKIIESNISSEIKIPSESLKTLSSPSENKYEFSLKNRLAQNIIVNIDLHDFHNTQKYSPSLTITNSNDLTEFRKLIIPSENYSFSSKKRNFEIKLNEFNQKSEPVLEDTKLSFIQVSIIY